MRKVMLFSVAFLFVGGATLLAQAKVGVVNPPAILEKSVEGKRTLRNWTRTSGRFRPKSICSV
jgi:hypothetical protein